MSESTQQVKAREQADHAAKLMRELDKAAHLAGTPETWEEVERLRRQASDALAELSHTLWEARCEAEENELREANGDE